MSHRPAANMVSTTLGENPAGEAITKDLLDQFEIGKVFDDNTAPITSIDFHASGEVCVTASADDSLRLYDAVNGTAKTFVWSKKYGCAHARFTHSRSSIIYASTKEDDTIRYHTLHENKYLRYFRGHAARVVDLEMSPNSDAFLSASADGEVRLWDLRTQHCQGLLAARPGSSGAKGAPRVAFDQVAKVFCVAVAGVLRLYDVGNYDAGPFSTLEIPMLVSPSSLSSPPPIITAIEFANDGKDILVSTSGEAHYLVDSYAKKGAQAVRAALTGHGNERGMELRATFSPDAQFSFSGSDDGSVFVWSSSAQFGPLRSGDGDVPAVVRWNPRYMMFATANGNQLAFWSPPAQSNVVPMVL
ncbi:WD40-repeat-containing domain protein [Geranomyces variabilis]|nr:WD40-repeat-containing domain protein [Geranomyces variabilis]KAJ3136912.1 WD repeat-containing protein 82 [Geranomyces variabilis]